MATIEHLVSTVFLDKLTASNLYGEPKPGLPDELARRAPDGTVEEYDRAAEIIIRSRKSGSFPGVPHCLEAIFAAKAEMAAASTPRLVGGWQPEPKVRYFDGPTRLAMIDTDPVLRAAAINERLAGPIDRFIEKHGRAPDAEDLAKIRAKRIRFVAAYESVRAPVESGGAINIPQRDLRMLGDAMIDHGRRVRELLEARAERFAA